MKSLRQYGHYLHKHHLRDGNKAHKTTVAVAMSGGIDSSAVALLLQEQGYDCVGVMMKNWDFSDEAGKETCPYSEDLKDMKGVCNRLNIPAIEVVANLLYKLAVMTSNI